MNSPRGQREPGRGIDATSYRVSLEPRAQEEVPSVKALKHAKKLVHVRPKKKGEPQ